MIHTYHLELTKVCQIGLNQIQKMELKETRLLIKLSYITTVRNRDGGSQVLERAKLGPFVKQTSLGIWHQLKTVFVRLHLRIAKAKFVRFITIIVLPCPKEPPPKPNGGWFYYHLQNSKYKCPNGWEFFNQPTNTRYYPYWYSNCTVAKAWDPPVTETCVSKC